MSSLDKLAIRGIRSFDHNDISVLQFFTPLTVIVGHNGSGKTTIIECLKYATTGDMPPNTKGGAFVHDPSIAGTSEVKAQVKLRFFNSGNEKMIVERRLQVTKKKTGGGLSLKTLEGVISFVEDDRDKKKRHSLSTKCAQLDEEVPRQLGVSKAILDNVIFCHQEESNWPLSEPAALKKKFDEIFEATKYTKALDQIKILKKDQAVEIKVDKEKLAALKTDRDRATKLRKTLETSSTSITLKETDHSELEQKIRKTVSENKHFYNQATKYQAILNDAKTLETQRELVEESMGGLRAGVEELSDSDAALAHKITSHESSLAASRVSKQELVRSLQDEQDAQSNHEKRRSEAQTLVGRLGAEKQRYLDNLTLRQTLIQEIATRHSIAGYDHDLSESEMKEFEARLDDEIEKMGKKISDMKTEAREGERAKEKIISSLKIAKAADERRRSDIADQIKSSNTLIRSINSQLSSTSLSVADISLLTTTLSDERKRKLELEETIKKGAYQLQLREKASSMRDLEERREELHRELTGLNAQGEVRAKLGLRRKEGERKEEAVRSLLDKSSTTFKRYTKKEPERATMEGEVNAVVQEKERDIQASERALKEATKELSAVETSVNLTRSKVKELKENALVQKKKVSDGLKGLDTETTSVEAAIKEAEEEVKLAAEQVKEKEGFVNFYRMLNKKGKKDKICMGCNRGLSKNELVEFEKFTSAQEARAPDALRDAQSDLEGWEKQVTACRKLLPAEVALTKLEKEDIPAAEKALKSHEDKLPGATAKAQDAGTKLAELKASLDELQLLKKTASDVMRMHRETEDIARDIAKLESELSASGSTATSDDIQEELSKVGEQIRTVSSAMDKIRTESQNQSSTLQKMGEAVHAAELQLNKKTQELKENQALEDQKTETQAAVEKLEESAKELEKKIRESDAPLKKAEEEAAEARRTFATTEASLNRELSGYNKSSEQLDMNQREIKAYITRGGEAQLQKSERDLKQHEAVVNEKKSLVASLQQQISQIERTLADSVAVLRNYKDNVQLREGRVKIEEYKRKIEELDVPNADKAYRQFDSEYNTMRKRQSDLQAHQAKLGGEIETMKKDLEDKKAELKTEYDNIDEKYKTELIKVKTAEVANSDLEKYGKALDSAIMSFHGHKMAEINDTIADLWTKTYQGTDIDKIMIKSDAEGKTAGARSYNYRVVMQKDNTEMDMRGRCSAGQKVLASIIIRLALAESFGVNCGIMALDEPTTNLDHDNIQALASALAELIKERQGQSNFQLIVITHDEQFLETLGGTGVLDKYWRVSRGDGGQVSTIEKQRLT